MGAGEEPVATSLGGGGFCVSPSPEPQGGVSGPRESLGQAPPSPCCGLGAVL